MSYSDNLQKRLDKREKAQLSKYIKAAGLKLGSFYKTDKGNVVKLISIDIKDYTFFIGTESGDFKVKDQIFFSWF